MKPYSKEFRGEVLAACDRGRSTREVATYFNVSESWVRRVKQERRELNKVAPCLTRRRTPLWAPLADRMRELIRHKPDLTLRELKAELGTELSVPTLQSGDVVVMDNLGVHKVAGVREAIAAAGARVFYLPPYSPDLNPIERVFSKFKWLLKSASARTVEALWSVCGDVLDRFTEAECRNCLKHCGSRYT
jgi:transposase